jgi:UDP-glucose:(heptosyl)LPS alpha-1,3-glucosyltransferase
MSSYRLAFAVVRYFPFGGMQRNLLRIARACAARGHDVHVFSSDWVGPQPEELSIHVLPITAWTNHGRNEKFGQALRDAVADGEFDCVVGSNRTRDLHVYYAGDPCYAARFRETKPAIWSVLPRYHTFLRQEEEVFRPEATTDILLSAHGEKSKFVEHYKTPAARFHLLPPGIARGRLLGDLPTPEERAAFRRSLGIGEGDLLLLSVGSAFRTKGVGRTIRAMASLPDDLRDRVHLVVVGQGKTRGYTLLARWRGLGGRIHFTGPREDLARFYHSADLLVHPALVENTGNALIEAMVCGLPVLTTANCGFAFHVTESGAGIVCGSPFDQRELDRELAAMLRSDDRDRWRRNAQAYCSREDLYSLTESAAEAIIQRARRNRNRQPAAVTAC